MHFIVGRICSSSGGFARSLWRGRSFGGLAFQIRDDILDVESDSTTLGKTAGKDVAAAKPTYPAVLGMAASRAELARLTNAAIAALAPLGARGAELVALARYVAERES